MSKKYSNKKLEYLANADLIWVKKSTYYKKLETDILKENKIPCKENENDFKDYPCDELVHEELWWDVCEIVNDLAQLVLDEREKRAKILAVTPQKLKHNEAKNKTHTPPSARD
jgi:hypothetical protein